MRKLMWGVAMAGALTLTGCASTSSGDSSATTTEPSNPANAVENASVSLENSQFLQNQNGDNGSCFTGSSYGACVVVKNVATNWNDKGELDGFGFSWNRQLNPGFEDRSTSGGAHGVGDYQDKPYTNPPAMGVGVVKIESAGAGAIGSFTFQPDSGVDPALANSDFESWLRVPKFGGNRAMCGFSGYVGCFISDVYGGAYVWQPNSYSQSTDNFPSNSGLNQSISGEVGQTGNAHPQVNFTAITAPVAITVSNNSSSPMTFAGTTSASNFVLSETAPNPELGAVVARGESTTFYGYRSLTSADSSIELSFTTPDGSRITTKTNLLSKKGDTKPSCDVQSGQDISKRFNCDASNPNAKIEGTSGTNDSPAVTVTYSVRS